jgi:hypothetical protein
MFLGPMFPVIFVFCDLHDFIMRIVVSGAGSNISDKFDVLVEESSLLFHFLFAFEFLDILLFLFKRFLKAVSADSRDFAFFLIDFDLLEVSVFGYFLVDFSEFCHF